jgi:hypothetical protein
MAAFATMTRLAPFKIKRQAELLQYAIHQLKRRGS